MYSIAIIISIGAFVLFYRDYEFNIVYLTVYKYIFIENHMRSTMN